MSSRKQVRVQALLLKVWVPESLFQSTGSRTISVSKVQIRVTEFCFRVCVPVRIQVLRSRLLRWVPEVCSSVHQSECCCDLQSTNVSSRVLNYSVYWVPAPSRRDPKSWVTGLSESKYQSSASRTEFHFEYLLVSEYRSKLLNCSPEVWVPEASAPKYHTVFQQRSCSRALL